MVSAQRSLMIMSGSTQERAARVTRGMDTARAPIDGSVPLLCSSRPGHATPRRRAHARACSVLLLVVPFRPRFVHALFLSTCALPPLLHSRRFYSTTYAGGAIAAANALTSNESDVAICLMGGQTHARRDCASGFSYVNDAVLAILQLLRVPAPDPQPERRVLFD